MALVIGDVDLEELRIYQGADVNFDISWFEEDGTTPVAMSAISGVVVSELRGTVLLNLNPTVDGTNTNIAHVAVSGATTDGLAPNPRAVWEIQATAAVSGERKKFMRGPARIFAKAAP